MRCNDTRKRVKWQGQIDLQRERGKRVFRQRREQKKKLFSCIFLLSQNSSPFKGDVDSSLSNEKIIHCAFLYSSTRQSFSQLHLWNPNPKNSRLFMLSSSLRIGRSHVMEQQRHQSLHTKVALIVLDWNILTDLNYFLFLFLGQMPWHKILYIGLITLAAIGLLVAILLFIIVRKRKSTSKPTKTTPDQPKESRADYNPLPSSAWCLSLTIEKKSPTNELLKISRFYSSL